MLLKLAIDLQSNPIQDVKVVLYDGVGPNIHPKDVIVTKKLIYCTIPPVDQPRKVVVVLLYRDHSVHCQGDPTFNFLAKDQASTHWNSVPASDLMDEETSGSFMDEVFGFSMDEEAFGSYITNDHLPNELSQLMKYVSSSLYREDGFTATITAAAAGSVKLLQILVNKQSDLNETDKMNRTPLWWAAYNNRQSTFDFLLDKGTLRYIT